MSLTNITAVLNIDETEIQRKNGVIVSINVTAATNLKFKTKGNRGNTAVKEGHCLPLCLPTCWLNVIT